MEEKMIIQSKRKYIKTLKIIVCIFLFIEIVGLILLFIGKPILNNDADRFYEEHKILDDNEYRNISPYTSPYVLSDDDYAIWSEKRNAAYQVPFVSYVLCGIGGLSIFWFLFLLAIAKMEINVTDKRVYGRGIFGKRIDLPLDSISAIGTGIFNGITVATSSGKIHFIAISNNKEIHEEISKLLIERQEKGKAATTTIKQEIQQSNADELEKYKNLLDKGVITQEEFDAKKKQLLGL